MSVHGCFLLLHKLLNYFYIEQVLYCHLIKVLALEQNVEIEKCFDDWVFEELSSCIVIINGYDSVSHFHKALKHIKNSVVNVSIVQKVPKQWMCIELVKPVLKLPLNLVKCLTLTN